MKKNVSNHPLSTYIEQLKAGGALLPDSQQNVAEVVGILKSYGVVLDAYYQNLIYISEHQFLVLFPFFKYFNGQVSWGKLWRYWCHDRINFEYAEYCMKTMLWHGGGGLEKYLDSEEFDIACAKAVQRQIQGNLPMQLLDRSFHDFLPEQVRLCCYYSILGQFWQVMSEIFLTMSDLYDRQEIQTIPEVVEHVKAGLVAAASSPITYAVQIDGQTYDIIPKSAGLTFLADAAIPYVEAIFFRGTPFMGTVSYNAQAHQISPDQSRFTYGALYADPLPIGGAGIPPTLLMQDMRHFLPDYLHKIYQQSDRGEDDLRVKICQSFQKSMFCVTTATILGLAPHALDSEDLQEQAVNQKYLETWMDRFMTSQLPYVQDVC
jgi:CO2 hydration protein